MRKLTLFALAFELASIPAVHADGTPAKKPVSKASSSPFDHWFGITGFAGFSVNKTKTTYGRLYRNDGTSYAGLTPLATDMGKTPEVGIGVSLMRESFFDGFHLGADVRVLFPALRVSHETRGKNTATGADEVIRSKMDKKVAYQGRLLLGYALDKNLIAIGAGLSRDCYKFNIFRHDLDQPQISTHNLELRKISPVYSFLYRRVVSESGHLLGLEVNYSKYRLNHHHRFSGTPDTAANMLAEYAIKRISVFASFTYKIT